MNVGDFEAARAVIDAEVAADAANRHAAGAVNQPEGAHAGNIKPSGAVGDFQGQGVGKFHGELQAAVAQVDHPRREHGLNPECVAAAFGDEAYAFQLRLRRGARRAVSFYGVHAALAGDR